MKTLRLNGEDVMVGSMEEAGKVVRYDIDETGVGATEWYEYTRQGEVREAGKVIGKISYNGRIWPVEVA
jgi:hypothetical protein